MTAENMLSAFRHHGGRMSAARAMFPSAPLPWIDLSTGVSPHPWEGPRTADLRVLPDPADIDDLEARAAAYFGCTRSAVAALAGADLGLRLLPHLLNVSSVAICSPTYQGHVEAWSAAGADVRCVARGDVAGCNAEAIVLVNPNNPDGATTKPASLLELLERQRNRNGWLIVDESFADVMPEVSIAASAQRGLIVLRSFGKFFGLPGLRLGFMVGDATVLKAVRDIVGAWPVSVEALQLGLDAYSDFAWHEKVRNRLTADAQRLDSLLIENGFTVCGGTALFRLVSCPNAEDAFLALAAKGILVRPFDYAPTWLRFGIPRADQWTRVREALAECKR